MSKKLTLSQLEQYLSKAAWRYIKEEIDQWVNRQHNMNICIDERSI
jgi:hypothetical protein